MRLANDTPYGLVAAVWSGDLARGRRVAQAVRAGICWINVRSMVDPSLPLVGFGHSGWGRENGREVLDAYTEVQTVYEGWD